tara:strand:+ start:251 stop:421 length:171 start_codon:yes stop_codon:yes gene_type:complete
MDFGYSLGVLHHIPDTQVWLNSCVQKLKKMHRFWFIFIIDSIINLYGLELFGNFQI